MSEANKKVKSKKQQHADCGPADNGDTGRRVLRGDGQKLARFESGNGGQLDL